MASYSLILGPVIGGRPPGYPTFTRFQKSKSTAKRSKPSNLITNPTTYSASVRAISTEADYLDGKEVSPYYGEVALNENAYWEINALKSALASQSDSRVLTKIKNEKWNLGTFLGELPQTQKYLKGVIPRICEFYLKFKKRMFDPKYWRSLVRRGKRFMKKRKLRGTKGGSGDLANAWLEFRYAVMPLAYDAQDMLNYLYDSALRMPIFRASSGAREGWRRVTRPDQGVPFTVVSDIQCRTTCYYSARVQPDALKRLGLINLPSVLWELTPLSFVADMVLPVGDFIGNFDAMVGVTVLSCTRSTKSTLEETRLRMRPKNNARVYGGSTGKAKFYYRSVISAPVNKPVFSKSATGQQLCDIVALMRTIVFK